MWRSPPAVPCALLACALLSAVFAADAGRNFSGKWVLDERGSILRALPAPAEPTFTVDQQDPAMRCSTASGQGSWTYLLDGTETRTQAGGETRSSIAKWEGAALLINTLVSGARDYTVMDRWKLSDGGATLTIIRQIVQRSGESESTLVYRREGEYSRLSQPASMPRPPVQNDPPPAPQPVLMRKPPPPADGSLTVAAGSRIALSLRNDVDTKHSHAGDHVYLETMVPVAVNGRIVIPRGSYVNGTITESKPAHGVKGKGEMFIRFDSLLLPNGVARDFHSRIASADASARGQVDSQEGKITGERDSSGDARAVAIGTGVGAGVGGIAGAAAGHPLAGVGIGAAAGAAAGLGSVLYGKRAEAVLRRGTVVEMVLDRDLNFASAELPY